MKINKFRAEVLKIARDIFISINRIHENQFGTIEIQVVEEWRPKLFTFSKMVKKMNEEKGFNYNIEFHDYVSKWKRFEKEYKGRGMSLSLVDEEYYESEISRLLGNKDTQLAMF